MLSNNKIDNSPRSAILSIYVYAHCRVSTLTFTWLQLVPCRWLVLDPFQHTAIRNFGGIYRMSFKVFLIVFLLQMCWSARQAPLKVFMLPSLQLLRQRQTTSRSMWRIMYMCSFPADLPEILLIGTCSLVCSELDYWVYICKITQGNIMNVYVRENFESFSTKMQCHVKSDNKIIKMLQSFVGNYIYLVLP